MHLGMSPNGPCVMVLDGAEKLRLWLGTSTSGEPELRLHGKDGKSGIRIGVGESGEVRDCRR